MKISNSTSLTAWDAANVCKIELFKSCLLSQCHFFSLGSSPILPPRVQKPLAEEHLSILFLSDPRPSRLNNNMHRRLIGHGSVDPEDLNRIQKKHLSKKSYHIGGPISWTTEHLPEDSLVEESAECRDLSWIPSSVEFPKVTEFRAACLRLDCCVSYSTLICYIFSRI